MRHCNLHPANCILQCPVNASQAHTLSGVPGNRFHQINTTAARVLKTAPQSELTCASCREPSEIPWGDIGADYVVESTGVFTTIDKVIPNARPVPSNQLCAHLPWTLRGAYHAHDVLVLLYASGCRTQYG